MANYKIGDLITFSYPAVHQKGTRAHDKYPQVLVLHDHYEGLVHGLNFNYLEDKEINFIKAVLNEDLAEKFGEKDQWVGRELNRLAAVYDTLKIDSPYDFYHKFVQGFIKVRKYDPYRKYKPHLMTNVRVITKREVLTGERKEGIFSKFVNRVSPLRGRRLF
jgi:hypothetical protein